MSYGNRTALILIAGLGFNALACEEAPISFGSASSARPVRSAPAPSSSAQEARPRMEIQEMDWQESERSRDPFRSFALHFVEEARTKVKSQRQILLDQYSLDELRLIGIVLGSDPPMAMLVDPTGKGHTVRRGQFVGRAEIVQSSGQSGAAYEVNWRVETIRDGDVVFVREDPQNPDVPSQTKVIPLRPQGSLADGEG